MDWIFGVASGGAKKTTKKTKTVKMAFTLLCIADGQAIARTWEMKLMWIS